VAPRARSLILDLLSTLGRRAAPVRALVEAAALFGIAGNNVRVTLARLLASGRVERDERGRYRLGPSARAISEQIRSWRHFEQRLRPWDGGWVAVHASRLPRSRARRRRDRALRFLGFRTLEPGLELRPDNLMGGIDAVRAQLHALGLEPMARVFRLSALDPATEARARGLWDVDGLVADYRATTARLQASAALLPELARRDAMLESFALGGDAIRQLALDPLLPEEIVPGRERRSLVSAMRRYDRLGRRAWKGWLGEDAPRPEAYPAGIRGAAGEVLGAVGGS
jgi:phenylacetic acid degradation operon negative regulatory protein